MIEEKLTDGFCFITAEMFNELDLKPTELLIYGIINGFISCKLRFTGSNNYLSKKLNISKKTATDTIKKLQDKGLITVSQMQGDGIKTHRVITKGGVVNSTIVDSTRTPSKNCSEVIVDSTRTPSKNCSQKRNININNKKKEKEREASPSHALPEIDSDILDDDKPSLPSYVEKYFLSPAKEEPIPKWQERTEFINTGKLPLKNFPEIFLIPNRLEQIIETLDMLGIDDRKKRNMVFDKVQQRVLQYKAEGRPLYKIDAESWITGWATKEILELLRQANYHQRSVA